MIVQHRKGLCRKYLKLTINSSTILVSVQKGNQTGNGSSRIELVKKFGRPTMWFQIERELPLQKIELYFFEPNCIKLLLLTDN
jgi:hypothetical protein